MGVRIEKQTTYTSPQQKRHISSKQKLAICAVSLLANLKCYIINTLNDLVDTQKERLVFEVVYLVKVYPTEHKVHGEERIAYAFSDTYTDDSDDVFGDALCQILAHRDEVGLFVDDEYAREVARHNGICALNSYMDFANIENIYDKVWNKD